VSFLFEDKLSKNELEFKVDGPTNKLLLENLSIALDLLVLNIIFIILLFTNGLY